MSNFNSHLVEWVNKNTMIYHYENEYGERDCKLTFKVCEDQYLDRTTIETFENNYRFDLIAIPDGVNRHGKIVPSEGCFFATVYEGESTIEDELVLAGCMEVTGRVINDFYVEVRLDPEWLASLPVKITNPRLEQNRLFVDIDNECGRVCRVAETLHGDFEWVITENNPYYDERSYQEHGYSIDIRNVNDEWLACSTGGETLVEAWLKALKYEKALIEFRNDGERIAKQLGTSFYKLFTNIAASNWYLEG